MIVHDCIKGLCTLRTFGGAYQLAIVLVFTTLRDGELAGTVDLLYCKRSGCLLRMFVYMLYHTI